MNNINDLKLSENMIDLINKIIKLYEKIGNSNLYSNKYQEKLFIQYCQYLKEITKTDEYYLLIDKISKIRKQFFGSDEIKQIFNLIKNKYPNNFKSIKKLKQNLNRTKNIIAIINTIKSINDNEISNLYKKISKLNLYETILQKKTMDREMGTDAKDIGPKFEDKVLKKIPEIINKNFGIKSEIKILNNVKIIKKEEYNFKTLGEIDHLVIHNNKTIAIFEDKINLDDIGYAFKQLNKICKLIDSGLENIILKDENEKILNNDLLLSLKDGNFYDRYFIISAYFKDKDYKNLKSSYVRQLLVHLWNNQMNYKRLYKIIRKNIQDENSPLEILEKYKKNRKLNMLIILSI